MADFFWFSDEQWARIEPLLPTGTHGMKRVDDRRVLSGIVNALQSGGRGGERGIWGTSSAPWLEPRMCPTGCSSTVPASRSTAPQAALKGSLGQWYRPDTRRP
jgi:hypothetical protein